MGPARLSGRIGREQSLLRHIRDLVIPPRVTVDTGTRDVQCIRGSKADVFVSLTISSASTEADACAQRPFVRPSVCPRARTCHALRMRANRHRPARTQLRPL